MWNCCSQRFSQPQLSQGSFTPLWQLPDCLRERISWSHRLQHIAGLTFSVLLFSLVIVLLFAFFGFFF